MKSFWVLDCWLNKRRHLKTSPWAFKEIVFNCVKIIGILINDKNNQAIGETVTCDNMQEYKGLQSFIVMCLCLFLFCGLNLNIFILLVLMHVVILCSDHRRSLTDRNKTADICSSSLTFYNYQHCDKNQFTVLQHSVLWHRAISFFRCLSSGLTHVWILVLLIIKRVTD